MEDILESCVALDTAARDTYRHFAEHCDDADLARCFERMAAEEASHVAWWQELLEANRKGRVPAIADEEALRASVTETAAHLGKLVHVDPATLTPDEMLERAIRMEFFMLDPAFGQLMDLLDPTANDHHHEAYSRHVMRLVNEVESRSSDRGLASFLARVLVRTARDQEALAALATRDPLTGLYNRRGFYSYLSQWAASSARYGHPLGVLLIDVDHFKEVNDTFGHPAGDEALCAVAKALSEAVRDSDLVGRYGGDEFAVLAPETTSVALETLADRVLQLVRGCELQEQLSGISLTVSIGAAYVVAGATATPESLLACADRSLYWAKDAGRDRVGTSIETGEAEACAR